MSDTCVSLRVPWPAPPRVHAAFSTRHGGVSRAPWAGLNLATHVGDDPANVAANRAALYHHLRLTVEPHWLEQVHGTEVVRLDDAVSTKRGDAAITRSPGRVAAVMVADCLPVLLCDEGGQEVAAVHAGWRGLDADIIAKTIACFVAPPSSLMAWLGPAIGLCAYRVGADLRARFVASDARYAQAFTRIEHHWHMDLARVAELQLVAAGVARITASQRCVHAEPDNFYSYRRDGETGRMAALVWIRDDL